MTDLDTKFVADLLVKTAVDFDWHAVAKHLAVHSPNILVNAVNAVVNPNTCWVALVDAEIRKGQKVPAIKFHRSVTGAGLKESKDYIEQRARDIGVSWKSNYNPDPNAPF